MAYLDYQTLEPFFVILQWYLSLGTKKNDLIQSTNSAGSLKSQRHEWKLSFHIFLSQFSLLILCLYSRNIQFCDENAAANRISRGWNFVESVANLKLWYKGNVSSASKAIFIVFHFRCPRNIVRIDIACWRTLVIIRVSEQNHRRRDYV